MHLKKQIYRAAIYLRISRDDENLAESGSIQNQRELLKSFIEKDPEIELVKEFADDGFTGTNFERPGYQKMMSMVEKKAINCIIVKDLSRLGRNYIETGRLIDQIFPMLGIRFIAVNDNYDSLNEFNEADRILIPFKNLINDAYCKDMSMKVRSQLDIKRRTGKFIGSFAPYGYRKDPKDKNHLIVDEEAAKVVQMVFCMMLDGFNPGHIAEHLDKMGVLTPQQYKRSLGLNSNAGAWRSEDPHWNATMVRRMLTSEIYIGNLLQGKNKKINYKVKQSIPVEKRKWIKVAGTHEAIITKAAFDRVQYMLGTDTRTPPEQDQVNIFSGMIKCADCGQSMVRKPLLIGGKQYCYFVCSTEKAGQGCSPHRINAEKLEKAVLHSVQKQMEILLNTGLLDEKMEDLPKDTHKVRLINDQIATLDREIAKYQELKENLYEDYREGIIDDNDYEQLKKRFVHKIQDARQSLRNVKIRRNEVLSKPIISPEWIREVRELGRVEELTRKTVVMLIDQIVVYDKKRIEIKFHYDDEIKELVGQEMRSEGQQRGGESA